LAVLRTKILCGKIDGAQKDNPGKLTSRNYNL